MLREDLMRMRRHAPVGTTLTVAYQDNELKLLQQDIAGAERLGWKAEEVASQSGHLNVGRTVAPALLTGGISLCFGASRTKGVVLMRFTRQSEPAPSKTSMQPLGSGLPPLFENRPPRGVLPPDYRWGVQD